MNTTDFSESGAVIESSVRLLIATKCPHCASTLEALTVMVKAGEIASLEVINLDVNSNANTADGVRSVPCIISGKDQLTGARSREEILHWLNREHSIEGMIFQLNEMLTTGGLQQALELVEAQSFYFSAIMKILANPESKINVRVGIGVIMEHFQGSKVLQSYLPSLKDLAANPSAPVRSDAAHYLALTESPAAVPVLQALLDDDSAEVCEIAADGLEVLVGNKHGFS